MLKDVEEKLKDGTYTIDESYLDDDDDFILFSPDIKSTRKNVFLIILKALLFLICYIIIGILTILEFLTNIIVGITHATCSIISGIGFTLVIICFLGGLLGLLEMQPNPFYACLPFYIFIAVIAVIPLLAGCIPAAIRLIKGFIQDHIM